MDIAKKIQTNAMNAVQLFRVRFRSVPFPLVWFGLGLRIIDRDLYVIYRVAADVDGCFVLEHGILDDICDHDDGGSTGHGPVLAGSV